MYQYGREINYSIIKLSPDNEKLLGDFTCGNKSIDHYIHHDCLRDSNNICYLCINDDTRTIIGFATLSCSGIHYKVDNISQTLPAIQISYFAIGNEYQKLIYDEEDEHFYFSDKFFGEILIKCREITETHIGAQYLVLYSVPAARHFYERNFCTDYTEYMVRDNYPYLKDCIPMYYEL